MSVPFDGLLSVPEKVNVIESVGSVPPFDTPLFRPSTAESMVVSGRLPTVNVQVAGVGSALLAASTAYTENVYEPSASPVYVLGEVQGRRCLWRWTG